jgi:hypothetical protein
MYSWRKDLQNYKTLTEDKLLSDTRSAQMELDNYELKTRIVGLTLALQDEINKTSKRDVEIANNANAVIVASTLRDRLSEAFAPETTLVRGSASPSAVRSATTTGSDSDKTKGVE